jgi:putative peptidoglycan lipid II flippase
MMVAALPLIDLVYRRGKFSFADTQTSAVYFFWFSFSLICWSAQGLYARAFYAAGDTLTPMVAATAITVASLPMYSFLFHTFGVVGLAWASDIGIAVNLVALAGLLHYRKLVPLSGLRWGELGKAALAAMVAGGITLEVVKIVPPATVSHDRRLADLIQLALVSLTWAAAAAGALWLLRSELPRDLQRRKGAAYPGVAHGEAKEILGSGTQP